MRISTSNGIVSYTNANKNDLNALKAGQFVDMRDTKRVVINKRQTLTFSKHHDQLMGLDIYSGTISVTFKTRIGLVPMATCGYKINNLDIIAQPHPRQDIQDNYQGTYIKGGGATNVDDGIRWDFIYNNYGLVPDPYLGVIAITDKLDITFQVISNMSGSVEVSNVSD